MPWFRLPKSPQPRYGDPSDSHSVLALRTLCFLSVQFQGDFFVSWSISYMGEKRHALLDTVPSCD